MPITRRDFLKASLSSAPFFVLSERLAARAQSIGGSNHPLLFNYGQGNQSIVVEGKTILARLSFPAKTSGLSGSFPIEITSGSTGDAPLTEPQPLYFHASGDGRTFHTFLTAPLDAVEGSHLLRLKAQESGTTPSAWEFPYLVQRGAYKATALTLDSDFSSPSPELVARMRSDFETMASIYRGRSARLWREPFMLPVSGPERDNFGVRRTVNGTKRYRHAGLDFTAPMGTLVRATNDGRVVFSGEQWVSGQAVCLDHGGGVFSRYIHLSRRVVGEGDRVRRGQEIARSGNSGGQRPGPHLHFEVVVNGTHVDPKDFMRTASQFLSVGAN